MTRDALPPLSEKKFLAMVVELARLFGWLTFHPFDSRRSAAGFPDVLLLRGRQLLVAELKVGKRQPTADQLRWLEAFRAAGVPAFVWTPSTWPAIEAALR
jgi:hypothetical protein